MKNKQPKKPVQVFTTKAKLLSFIGEKLGYTPMLETPFRPGTKVEIIVRETHE